MDQKYTLGFLFLTALLAVGVTHESEDTYNQVFNIHSGYRSEAAATRTCVTEKSMEDMMERLIVNLTDVLEEQTVIKPGVSERSMVDMMERLVVNFTDVLEEQTVIKPGVSEKSMEDMMERLIVNLTDVLEEKTDSNRNNRSCKETFTKPRDCQDIKNEGYNTTGIYTIYPGDGTKGIQVRCDMDTKSGGWTVIQRRVSDSDFFKTWYEYKTGFGNLTQNFWLGNDIIHEISAQKIYQLRVDLISDDGQTAFAEYGIFFIGDSDSDYKLLVDWFVGGNAGDSLKYHNGQRFSTKDRDNDSDRGRHCAQIKLGAWWYNACLVSNLNGDYGATDGNGPNWTIWKGHYEPMKKTEMKIRPWHR